jgi:hypothetical protein
MKGRPVILLSAVFLSLSAIVLGAQPNETIISHIPRESVQSSALAAVGYSKRLQALEIEFVNGAIYRYLDVPPSVYHALMKANSKARFYDANIRGKYRSLHVRSRPK